MRRVLLALLLWAAASACAAAEEVVTIPTRTGVTLSYLLVQDPSASPKVVVIGFVGGEGVINLAKRSENRPPSFGPATNFLIRIRSQMTDVDIAEAIVDSPSDQLPQGMTDNFRFGADHLADIRALVADLRKRFPNAKIDLMGHSRGTVSAAVLAAKLGAEVQGVILASTITKQDKQGRALATFNFATIKIRVLLVHHREDGCTPNPYYNVERLSKSFALISVRGGDPPQSGPCDSQSPHGFFGRDAAVVQAIKNWMRGRDFAREIG